MTYQTTYAKRNGYFSARIVGPESFQEAVRFWRDLAKTAAENGHSKFLVVDGVDGLLSTSEHYYLSLIVAELFAGKRIAYVALNEASYGGNKFGETVVVNRGVTAKVFRTEEEAVAWLMDQSNEVY